MHQILDRKVAYSEWTLLSIRGKNNKINPNVSKLEKVKFYPRPSPSSVAKSIVGDRLTVAVKFNRVKLRLKNLG